MWSCVYEGAAYDHAIDCLIAWHPCFSVSHSDLFVLCVSGHTPFPAITLYHWDLPQWIENTNEGWLSPRTAAAFADFADNCFRHFGDRVGRRGFIDVCVCVMMIAINDVACR